MSEYEDQRDIAVLEVINRDHECSDPWFTARFLALNLIYERKGKLFLTLRGMRLMLEKSC